MDTLFIGDIPAQYHYAIFNNGYIDLYDTQIPTGSTTYYRVYTNCNGFYYSKNFANIMGTREAVSINTTDNICYRSDFPSIMIITLCFALFGIFLFNIMSSIIRKGGVLGGLL